jgi:sugar-specific transcriptional regulator TrmB
MVDESPGKKKVYRARDIEASLGMRVKELNTSIGRINKIVQKTRTTNSVLSHICGSWRRKR